MSERLAIGSLALACAFATALFVTNAAAAASDDRPCAGLRVCPGGHVVDDAVIIVAGDDQNGDVVDSGRASQASVASCTFSPPPPNFDRELDPVIQDRIPRRAVYYVRNCGGSDQYLWYVPGTGDGPADPVVQLLVDEAIERIRPPAPFLVTSPPVGSPVLTGMPIYLAVDDTAFTALTGSVSAGQFTVTATVVPVDSRFTPGDQHEAFTCPGAGSRWSHGQRPGPDDCTHTYTHTPAHLTGDGTHYTLQTQVRYTASYVIEGPVMAGEYDLGDLDGPTSDHPIEVTERRAVRTG